MFLALKLAVILMSTSPLPFPAPKIIQATDALRSDVGTVVAVDTAKAQVRMNAPAGEITYKVAEAQVVGPDGKPAAGGLAALKSGQNVRVYYVVDKGAIAKEIDIQP